MDENDSFDMSQLRELQLEALKVELRQNLLTSKIHYKDAIRRIDYMGIKYVARLCNLAVEYRLGVIPICFMEN